jgi:hypothetical protein
MVKARKKPRVMPLRAKHTKQAAKASARSEPPRGSSLLLVPVGAAIAVFIHLTHVLRRTFMSKDMRKMPPAPSRTHKTG